MASANTTTALIVLLGLAVADCFVPAHMTHLQATRQTRRSERLSRHIPQCAMETPVVRRDALGQWTHALAIGTLLQVGALSAVAEDSSPPLGSSRRPVVVLGAGGKLGKEVVLSLLRKGGYGVRACSRGQLETSDLGSADFPADDVDVMTGIDVTKPETLQEALVGAGAVIVCSSASAKGGKADAVDCIGVENVAKACLSAQVERLILVSSLGVTRQNSLAYKMTNTLGNIMDWKEQGEERVRAAYKGQDKLSYTIVRPGGLEQQAVGLDKVMLVQGDTAYSPSVALTLPRCAWHQSFGARRGSRRSKCCSAKPSRSRWVSVLRESPASTLQMLPTTSTTLLSANKIQRLWGHSLQASRATLSSTPPTATNL